MSNVLDMKLLAAEDTLEFLVEPIFETLYSAGYKAPDERVNNVLIAALRGIMHAHLGLEHPLIRFINTHDREIDLILKDQITWEDLGDIEVLEGEDLIDTSVLDDGEE